MNFPPFWARGSSGDFHAWRWSSRSVAEAQALADTAAQQLADRFRTGNFPPKHGAYYPDRPFREQILEEIRDEAGQKAAVITRNSYGAQVLNTAWVMFVDIDLPEAKPAGSFLSRLFRKREVRPPDTPQAEIMGKIESWTRRHGEWGWRVYRTRSGLRLMATQGLAEADSEAANTIFTDLGADPLYQRLCKTQKCFRARLTPKPWRCGVNHKPERWPWLTPGQEKEFQKWETEYREKSREWATCAFLRSLGNPVVHPEVQRILELHDRSTRAESGLPLA